MDYTQAPVEVDSTLAVLYAIAASVSLAAIAYLCWFVIEVETRRRGHSLAFKNIATPFNTILLSFGLSLLAMFIGQVLIAIKTEARDQIRLASGVAACAAAVETSYLLCCWNRGQPVVEIVMPQAIPYLKWVPRILPFLYLSEPAYYSLDSSPLFFDSPNARSTLKLCYWGLVGIAGIGSFVFEGTILYSYRKYLAQYQLDTGKSTAGDRLQIISLYGNYAVVASFLAFSFYLVGFTVPSVSICFELYAVCYYCMLGAFLIILKMKVTLHNHNLASGSPGSQVKESVMSSGYGTSRKNIAQ